MHVLRTKFSAIVHYFNVDKSLRRVASQYGVSKSTLSRWAAEELRYRNRKDLSVAKTRKPRTSIVQSIAGEVRAMVENDPFVTISMIHGQLIAPASMSTVQRCLKSLRLSYKATSRTRKGQPVDLKHPFFTHKVPFDENMIAIDEASYVSCDTPRRGWSMKGQTLHKHPPKRRRVVSLLLAIDRNGVVDFEIKKGSFNQHSFSAFISRLPPDKTIVLDNVSLHRTIVVRQACERRNIRLRFTPPYSPWFNPTEYAFSVSKRDFRRRRGLREQGGPGFEDDIRASLQALTGPKCASFYDHASKLVLMTKPE